MPIGTDATCALYDFNYVTAFGNTTNLPRQYLKATCKKCAIPNGQILSFDAKYEQYVPNATLSECRKFDKIVNCDIYGTHVNTTAAEDRLLLNCTKCLNNYYLDNTKTVSKTENGVVTKYGNSCLIRTYNDTNCLKYQVDDDKCEVCAFGYFKDTTSSKCK